MTVKAETTQPTDGCIDSASSNMDGATWRAHPLAAQTLRFVVLLLPMAASVGVVVVLDRALPSPGSWPVFAAIAVVDALAALTVALLVHRLAMRVLPLATLLSLSLVFPDQAPRRFAIALRANSTSQLRTRLLASHDMELDVTSAMEDILTYLAALSRHDRITRGHCERVRAFVDLLAKQMGLSAEDQDRLRWAALLHDIGKLRVPGPILRKPGKPSEDEWETLRRHPVDGAEIIKPLSPWLGPWASAVEQHHERFDGRGYPMGLSGDKISMGGRILAVADSYEVMITSRPYKRPVRPEAARQELVQHADQQFDPEIVRAFLEIAIGDLRKVMGILGVLSEVPLLATVPRAEALLQMAGRQTAGVVGTAAGTGALVAAATLSPVHLPAAAGPSARIEITPTTPTLDKPNDLRTIPSDAPSQSATDPVGVASQNSASGGGGSSESNTGTASSSAGSAPASGTAPASAIVPASATTPVDPTADPPAGAPGTDAAGTVNTVPDSLASTTKAVASTVASAADTVTSAAADTVTSTADAATSAADTVTSTADAAAPQLGATGDAVTGVVSTVASVADEVADHLGERQ